MAHRDDDVGLGSNIVVPDKMVDTLNNAGMVAMNLEWPFTKATKCCL
jgi:hypothetical protein